MLRTRSTPETGLRVIRTRDERLHLAPKPPKSNATKLREDKITALKTDRRKFKIVGILRRDLLMHLPVSSPSYRAELVPPVVNCGAYALV